ncbi:helix-turn-helix domain-containing protein [Sporosarcina sp. P17b]|uniref:helix-turn-helix domain-containing protein n=1 Tax=Sporosarcina sp. P17b TaxID=2048260 RepID=UPI000C1669CB|nr:helix-turn-helix domain-containing protein [Sporosarcina sp. P17b]PIC75031.1 excisionase [Sporosarcina sp. P17b]
MQNKIMTVKQTAEFLGTSITTIYTACRENELPHFRVRGKILFNRDILESWTRGEYQMEQIAK